METTKTTKKISIPSSSANKQQTTTTETTETARIRPQYGDAKKQELSNKGFCFNCKKTGHFANECPDKPSRIRALETVEDISSSDSGKE